MITNLQLLLEKYKLFVNPQVTQEMLDNLIQKNEERKKKRNELVSQQNLEIISIETEKRNLSKILEDLMSDFNKKEKVTKSC